MVLRDQPYIPLYIKDFMTDEKLIECSAETTGVYIRLMCILHKQKEYGKLLLKQKYKQNKSNISNFATMLDRQMPFSITEIDSGLSELVHEKVIEIKDDVLSQKRMVYDGDISTKRAEAGSKGGKKTQGVASGFAKAKNKANPVNAIETEGAIESTNENELEDVYIKLIPDCLKTNKFIDMLYVFTVFRRNKGRAINSIQEMEIFLNKLQKLSKDDSDNAIQILENSISAGYPDIYELKKKQTNQKQPEFIAPVNRFKVKECKLCGKNDGFQVLSETKKYAMLFCNACKKEFEVP